MKASSEGPRRGEEARRRLVQAAVRVFGESGYHAVGTRDLAEAAGTNQAAIPYYFGGKEGLHKAAAQDVAKVGHAAFEPLLDRVKAAAPASLDRPALVDLVTATFRGLTRGLVGPLNEGYRAAFVMNEQLRPGPAFDVLYDGYIRPVHEAITTVTAAAQGRGAGTTRSVMDAHALFGTALAFLVARHTLCRRLGWDDYNPRRLRDIEDTVVSVALRTLGLANASEVES